MSMLTSTLSLEFFPLSFQFIRIPETIIYFILLLVKGLLGARLEGC